MLSRYHWITVLGGAVGGTIAIAAMEHFSMRGHFPLFAVPFATSIVLVMGSPEVDAAQPRALIGGHLVATLVGLIVLQFTGPGPWAAAAAVGFAIAAMHLTGTFHPPAGIDPLIVVAYGMSLSFLIVPVAVGACLLALFAFLWLNLVHRRSWPLRRW
jgi:CBS-domain-containing membrane protein